MDNAFIGEHGIRLDLVCKTSNNEVLNIKIQKENDVLLKQTVDSSEEDNICIIYHYLAKLIFISIK